MKPNNPAAANPATAPRKRSNDNLRRFADQDRSASTMKLDENFSVRRVTLATASALIIISFISSFVYLVVRPHSPQFPPTLTFIGYTNAGGQMEALFRYDHPTRPALADGLSEVRYQTSTGWARPSVPSVGFEYFGWDGTGSSLAITVETTNVPARVVMAHWTRRKGFSGLYDRLLDEWTKLNGQPHTLRGDVIYLTNQTVGVPSNR
jgi:hypothetical protein